MELDILHGSILESDSTHIYERWEVSVRAIKLVRSEPTLLLIVTFSPSLAHP